MAVPPQQYLGDAAKPQRASPVTVSSYADLRSHSILSLSQQPKSLVLRPHFRRRSASCPPNSRLSKLLSPGRIDRAPIPPLRRPLPPVLPHLISSQTLIPSLRTHSEIFRTIAGPAGWLPSWLESCRELSSPRPECSNKNRFGNYCRSFRCLLAKFCLVECIVTRLLQKLYFYGDYRMFRC